jgi:hypothetical protein
MGYATVGDLVRVRCGKHKGTVGRVTTRAVGIRPFNATMLTLFFIHPEHGNASVVVQAKDCFSIPTPNPGSDDAISLGCTCPVLDNSHGKGWMGGGEFWITEGCPVHSRKDVDGKEDAFLRDDHQQGDIG